MQRAKLLVVCLLMAGMSAAAAPASATHAGTSHDFSFDHRGGNEWWVEARVTLAENPSVVPDEVHARDEGGEWVALSLRDWGNWAGSFHVEPGHRVQFRAIVYGSMSNAYDETSCWFTHPGGAEECPVGGGDGEFQARYDPTAGNEWWVQVDVDANAPLASVDARANGGPWHPLEKKDWGDWAASFHVPHGSLVEFRATSLEGATHVSGKYRWPGGEPVDGSGGEEFAATFRPKAGNEWWVEVYVDANAPLAGVDARADGGAWHELTKRSWGAWAASFHVPHGSTVEFRATSEAGDTALSGKYRWPDATPVDGADGESTWPREGSYVEYHVRYGTNVPDGSYSIGTELNVTSTYRDGRWEAVCEGFTYETGYEETFERHMLHARLEPPRGPTDTFVGETVSVDTLGFCQRTGFSGLVVEGTGTEEREKNGEPVTVPVWRAAYEPECNCQGASASWHTQTGLLTHFHFAGRTDYEHVTLEDTDAPIAQDDEPLAQPPREGWPFEGSHVAYEVHAWFNSSYTEDTYRVHTQRFTFTDGAWRAECGDHMRDGAPPMGPLRIASGDEVVMSSSPCHAPHLKTVAQALYPERTTRNGDSYEAEAWWADEPDGAADRDAWWDTNVGLLLRWEENSSGWRTLGRLTDTDAPLAPSR